MPMLDAEAAQVRYPTPYPWVQPIKEAMWKGFWTAKKFDFDADLIDFKMNMTETEKQVVLRTIAAIAQIEVKVKAYWAFLGLHIKDPAIVGGGIVMAGVEEIHNDAYEKLILKLGKVDVLREMLEVPAIAGRVAYLTKHTRPVYGEDERKQFIYSLILFTMFVENVSLFSQFYTILWMNSRRNILKDTAQQVKYTRNEELLHAQFGMKIVGELRREYPDLFDAELETRVREEAIEAFKAECNLIDWMLEDYDAPGLNPDTLKGYVKMRLNDSMKGIGYAPIFNVDAQHEADTLWVTLGQFAQPQVDFFNTEDTGYVQADRPDEDDF